MWVPWKKSLLVIHKMLKLFVNTLTVDDKHYMLNRDNLIQPIQIELSLKQKIFSKLFFCIFEIYIKFWTFAKKEWPSELMYLGKSRLQKIWLEKCLISRVSEDLETDNIENWLKHFGNLNRRTFTIFAKHFEGRYVGKSLF